jgi:hypothetical protein
MNRRAIEWGWRELEEMKKTLVKDWSALAACTTSQKHQMQPDMASNQSSHQHTITSNLRSRMRRRCRQHGCVNGASTGLPEKCNSTQLQGEGEMGHNSLTTVPFLSFRGRRRRRVRRAGGLFSLDGTPTRVEQSHSNDADICSSFITGWSLFSQDHDLRPSELKRLMSNPIQLQLGLGSLPLLFQTHGGGSRCSKSTLGRILLYFHEIHRFIRGTLINKQINIFCWTATKWTVGPTRVLIPRTIPLGECHKLWP